jgi:hypothetical protein
VGNRTVGLLFRSSTGAQLLQSNTLSDSLHPTLKAIEHVKGGFNIFRRFRITRLQKTECPEVLRHFWSGHAPRHVSERYTKLREDSDLSYRPQLGNLGNCTSFRKSPKLLKRWWTRGDSNPRPPRCERGALPAELLAHRWIAANDYTSTISSFTAAAGTAFRSSRYEAVPLSPVL